MTRLSRRQLARIERERDRRRYHCTPDQVRFEFDGEVMWRVRADEILAVGEFTTDGGPWFEDFFLCFVDRLDGGWARAPAGAPGNEDVRDWLRERFDATFVSELVRSTDCASRVMWPAELLGQPLIRFDDPPMPSGLVRRALRRVFGAWSNVQTITPEVLDFLRRRHGERVSG